MKSYNPLNTIVGHSYNVFDNIFNFHNCTQLLTAFFIFFSMVSLAGEIKKREALITSNANSSAILKSANSPLSGPESLRTSLYFLNSDNTTVLADGVLIEYNNLFHDSVSLEDAYKFTNIGENLGLTRYGAVLAIERRPIITDSDTLYFKLWKTSIRNYQLGFVMANLDHPGMQAFLEDAYLGTKIQLALNGTTKINFSINSDTASSNANRFRIIYKTTFAPAAPLPVTFTAVKCYPIRNAIAIEWNVENETNIEQYEVERSANGSDFMKLNSVSVKKLPAAYESYSLTDNNPNTGNNFYRIKSVDLDGAKKFSQIVKVTTGNAGAGSVRIYPNPISGNMINIQFANQPAGMYGLKMTNSSGQVIYTCKLNVSMNNMSQPIFTNRKLAVGIYLLEIHSPDNTIQIKKIIVTE